MFPFHLAPLKVFLKNLYLLICVFIYVTSVSAKGCLAQGRLELELVRGENFELYASPITP